MTIAITYETHRDLDNPFDYPRMYKLIKDDNTEIARSYAEFSDAPEEAVQAYLVEFKAYILDIVSSIPEVKYADTDTRKRITTLERISSYLNGAMPAELPIDNEETV
jgi:hypothetical protein